MHTSRRTNFPTDGKSAVEPCLLLTCPRYHSAVVEAGCKGSAAGGHLHNLPELILQMGVGCNLALALDSMLGFVCSVDSAVEGVLFRSTDRSFRIFVLERCSKGDKEMR